jgi:hypothetical protein
MSGGFTMKSRQGDVLGISDARPAPEPGPRRKRGRGHIEGIEVRTPATGIGDVPQRTGATGIDMGGAGEGTGITPAPERAATTEDEDHE